MPIEHYIEQQKLYVQNLREQEDFKSEEEMLKNAKIEVVHTRVVEVCFSCGGLGFMSSDECVDYHRRDYLTVYRECARCNGTGLLLIEKMVPRMTGVNAQGRCTPFEGTREEAMKINRGW